jgi:hypothetical protein
MTPEHRNEHEKMRMKRSTKRKISPIVQIQKDLSKTNWGQPGRPPARGTRRLLGKRGVLAPRGRAGENGKQDPVRRAQSRIDQATLGREVRASLGGTIYTHAPLMHGIEDNWMLPTKADRRASFQGLAR